MTLIDLDDDVFSIQSCPQGGFADLEMTHEQHLRNLSAQKKGRMRLGSLMMPKKRHNRKKIDRDSVSLCSDSAVQSVTNYTVASSETVKASNTATKSTTKTDETVLKKRWLKLKNVLGLKAVPESAAGAGLGNRVHSYSADYMTSNTSRSKPATHKTSSLRSRLGSSEQVQKRVRSSPAELKLQQYMHDQSVTCRLDGLDVLSLGPARFQSLSTTESPHHARKPACWDPPPHIPYTAIGLSTKLTPEQMITNMLWTSCGRELPEIILEGFVPGADDRWSVRIEQREPVAVTTNESSSILRGCWSTPPPAASPYESPRASVFSLACTSPSSPPSLAPAHSDDCETSEEGSSVIIPNTRLWPTLWGDRIPPHATLEAVQDDDPLMTLAAEHSIPIDLDENTFCVSERGHLETIHSFVTVSLSMGRFETAALILKKLIKGTDLLKEHMLQDQGGLRFLKGSTLHNLGIIYMWQGDFESALVNFHDAVQERKRTLPKDHPDIAVSMAREAMVQFALGRFEEALFAMELVLPMTVEKSILRSKLLNNIGVLRYMKRDFATALREFTSALEIQRGWLEGDVRRDTLVYDASTTLGNMGKLYLERQDYQRSYYVYEEALLLQTTIFRKDHGLVLSSLTSLALIRAWDDQVKGAMQILQGCLRSQTARFGKEGTPCIETIALMGALYENMECLEDALKCYITVKRWQKANLSPDHPALRKTKIIVDKIEEALGKNASIWV